MPFLFVLQMTFLSLEGESVAVNLEGARSSVAKFTGCKNLVILMLPAGSRSNEKTLRENFLSDPRPAADLMTRFFQPLKILYVKF